MLEINEINNISVIISSLDKIYKKGQLTGKLNSSNLYILNIIYNLLDNCCLELTNEQRILLMNMYRNIYFYSENICKVSNIKKYKIEPKIVFEQAEVTDCNQYTKFEKIYYWQEENFLKNIAQLSDEIDDTNFFNDKRNDTEINFNSGVDCIFDQIGKTCFAILDAKITDNYQIYDYLNNNVTHMFDTIFVNSIKTRLFFSNNIYAHSLTNFKIKKENIQQTIFNTQFNQIFE